MTTKNDCMNMNCKQCNHIFVRNFILPRSVEDVILDIQMLKCPDCGASYEQISILTGKQEESE